MIFKEEGQLLQNIKQGQRYRVTLLYGEEKHCKDLYLKKIIKLSVGDHFPELNLHRFNGNELDLEKVLEACESMPFMAEQRCVVVEKFDYEGLTASDKTKFDALLKEPVETTVLILVVDKEEFNPKKSAKAKRLVELCDKAGAVLYLAKRSAGDLARFIKARAESRGCMIDRGLCDLLTDACENDMLTLTNEIDKLTAYVSALPDSKQNEEGQILVTKEQIEAVVCKTIRASIYDLAKAILDDRFEKAMTIVEDLLYLRYQPTAILASLAGAYGDYYLAKVARNSGKGEGEIRENFNYKGRDFLIRNSLRDCGKYSIQALRKSVCYLAEVDYRLKSSRAEDRIILEQSITELFLIAK